MPIHAKTRHGIAHLSVSGEMTIYTAAELKAELLPWLDKPQLEMDLSEVSEMDSAGLQLLILAKREAQQAGHSLQLSGHSRAVLEVFDLCNMAAYFGDPIVISQNASA